jgi:fibronectin-binding autotransporter adhesin
MKSRSSNFPRHLNLIVTGILMTALPGHSADTLSTTAGAGSIVWGTASNWQDGSFALAADDVLIDRSNGSTATSLGLNATQAANSITFGSDSGTALGTFSLRANTSGAAARALTLTTGNITMESSVTGDVLVGEVGFGTMSMDTAAAGYTFTNNSTSKTLKLTTNFTTAGKTVSFSDAGGGISLDTQLMTPTFASLSGGTTGSTVITNGGASGTKTVILNATSGTTTYSGKLTDGATATIALTKSGVGAEQILTGASSYSGTTTISGGILTLNGTNSGVGATALSGATSRLNVNNAGALSSGLFSLTNATAILDNTSGAAITSQTNNPNVFFSNFTFGTAGITDSSHDLNLGMGAVSYSGSGSPAFSFAGTGSTLTFGGVLSGQPGKTLGVQGAGNTVSFGGVIIGNGATTSQNQGFYGSANVIIEGTVSNAIGLTTGTLAYSGTGKLTLKGTNDYNGSTSVAASGIINIRNSSALGAADGTTTTQTSVASGGTLQLQGGITVGDERLSIVGTGATGTTGALQNVSGINTYGGAIVASASTTIASDSGTLNLTGAISVGGSSPMLRFTGAGNGNITNSITQVNGTVSKTGAGTWTLSGTNSYGAQTSVSEGTLKFVRTASLYNSNTSLWTTNNIRVASGGTLAVNVGGTDEFTTGNVTTLLTNLATSSNATTNGMAAGSALGFDTTNASGGTFTIANAIADTTGTAGGARGFTKLGSGSLELSNTNTYTGNTSVNAGKLIINGNISTSSPVSVSSGATLGGSGGFGSASISGILAPGNGIGTITARGDVTWSANDAWVFELGSAVSTLALAGSGSSIQDLLNITGAGSDFLKGSGSSFSFDFGNTGEVGFYKLVDWTGSSNFVASDFLASNLNSGLTGVFTVDSETSALYLNVIPEPDVAALFGGLGILLMLRRRRA